MGGRSEMASFSLVACLSVTEVISSQESRQRPKKAEASVAESSVGEAPDRLVPSASRRGRRWLPATADLCQHCGYTLASIRPIEDMKQRSRAGLLPSPVS